MIKILKRKPNSLFVSDSGFIDTTDLYNVSLIITEDTRIPSNLLDKYLSDASKITGFIDENGDTIKIDETDTILLLKKPYFIGRYRHDKALQQIINQIKNYNSHDNT